MTRIIAMLLLLLSFGLQAQDYSSKSKKAVKNFETARSMFTQKQDVQAEAYLRRALAEDGKFYEAWFMLAQIYIDRQDAYKAVEYYLNGLTVDPEKNGNGYLKLAELESNYGMYEDASLHLDVWRSYEFKSNSTNDRADMLEDRLEFALQAINNPVPFEPKSLGPAVNTGSYEYWPSISIDENTIFFTVLRPPNPDLPPQQLSMQEDFYFASREGDQWTKRTYLGPPVNTNSNEGAQSITADGSVIFFTACNRPDGEGLCDIYFSEIREDGGWTKPMNLGKSINSKYSEKHPSITSDGRILYFTSNRPGGKGKYDIYLSVKRGDSWSEPVNLGDSVNTSGTEQSPFIHADQRTLYFSSNGWPGLGQGDIYMTHWTDGDGWHSPKNLGYPINTFNEEIGFIVNAAGTQAYYSSNRREGTDTDIYTFSIPEEVRPNPVSYVAGRVYDSRNYKGIKANFQLFDLETSYLVTESESLEGAGEYMIGLPSGTSYAFNVSQPGYLFYSDHFNLSEGYSQTKPFLKDIPLEPIRPGKMIVLKNIFYDTEAFTLRDASKVELYKIREFLTLNPNVRIEISGHTDNTGTDAFNQELSEKRAAAVINYLIEAGISAERLESKGYGASHPVGDNATEEGKAANRRTELKIL